MGDWANTALGAPADRPSFLGSEWAWWHQERKEGRKAKATSPSTCKYLPSLTYIADCQVVPINITASFCGHQSPAEGEMKREVSCFPPEHTADTLAGTLLWLKLSGRSDGLHGCAFFSQHYHSEQPVGNTVREDGVKWGFKRLFQSNCKHGGNVIIKLCFGC